MKLKTLLVLGASMLATATAFADGWVKPTLPVPETTPFVASTDDGDSYYLYNVEYNGFYGGSNAWGTRSSIVTVTTSYLDGSTTRTASPLKVKFILQGSGLYGIKGNTYTSPDNATSIWVDGGRTNFDKFGVTPSNDNTFKITNAAVLDGATLGYLANTTQTMPELNLYTAEQAAGTTLCDTWALVTIDAYNAVRGDEAVKEYKSKMEIYNAADSLGQRITSCKAQYPGITFATAETVYANTSSTLAELRAAYKSIDSDIQQYILGHLDYASLTNPIDISSQIAGCDLANVVETSSSISNYWTRTFTGTGTTGTIRKNTWSTEGKSDGTGILTPFIENWVAKGSSLSDQICQLDTVKIVPGAYKITARVRLYNESGATSITSPYIFANLQQKNIVDPTKEVSENVSDGTEGYFTYNSMLGYYAPEATAYAVVGTDSCLTFGLKLTDVNYNWQAHKDYKVYYLGKSYESLDAARTAGETVGSYSVTDILSKELKSRVNACVSEYSTSSTADAIIAAMTKYNALLPEISANKAAWKAYMTLGEEGKTLSENESYSGTNLTKYMKDLYKAYTEYDAFDDEYFMSLNTQQVIAETAKLQEYIDEAKAMTPAGTDVSDQIKNADFASGWTGWSHSGTGGDVATNTSAKCAQAWNSANFDIHQDIIGVPAGMYQVKVQGFYRYLRGTNAWLAYFNEDGTTKEDPVDVIKNTPSMIYLNDNTNPMANVFDYKVANGELYTTTGDLAPFHYTSGTEGQEDYYSDPYWYPNDMTAAGQAFDAGAYTVDAAGAVAAKGDTLRIGVKGNSNQGGDSWAIFTRFKLVYQGYRMKYIAPEVTKQLAYLEAEQDSIMGKDIKEQVVNVYDELSEIETEKEYTDDDLSKENFETLCKAYALKNKINASSAIFNKLAAQNSKLEEALGNTEASEEILGLADELNNTISENLTAGEWTDEDATAYINKVEIMIMRLSVPAAIEEAIANADPENTVDCTSLIKDASFETSDGTAEMTAWTNAGTQSFGTQTNSSYNKTGNVYCERWHAAGTLNLYQTIWVPAGTYRVNVDAFASNKGLLYVKTATSNDSVAIKNTENSLGKVGGNRVFVFMPEAGTMTIGVKGTLTASTWFCIDNFRLTCIQGGGEEMATALLVPGDADGDDATTKDDIDSLFTVITGKATGLEKDQYCKQEGIFDVNGDHEFNVLDINYIINQIINANKPDEEE